MLGLRFIPHSLLALAVMTSPALADNYANLFDDESCSVNGSGGVNLHDPGCLHEPDRRSIYIPRTGAANEKFTICYYNQAYCTGSLASEWQITATGWCAPLNHGAASYRIVAGSSTSNDFGICP